jgi:hypothetical protein
MVTPTIAITEQTAAAIDNCLEVSGVMILGIGSLGSYSFVMNGLDS